MISIVVLRVHDQYCSVVRVHGLAQLDIFLIKSYVVNSIFPL